MKHLTLFLLLSVSLTAFSQDKNDTIEVGTGVYMIRHKDSLVGLYRLPTPDTLRVIILATMCRKCAAEPMPGYVVIAPGKRPVYLNRCKKALKWPQAGWDFREVNKNDKK